MFERLKTLFRKRLPTPRDDSDRRLLADVASQGCHVIKVPRSERTPAFAHSIGLYHKFRHPEILVVGLDLLLMHRLINDMRDLIREGTHFAAGSRSSEVLTGLDCEFRAVAKSHYADLFGYARWFYHGDDFPALQCIWPDPEGHFPGQPDLDPAFHDVQPTYERSA
jgi:hypothetical protein